MSCAFLKHPNPPPTHTCVCMYVYGMYIYGVSMCVYVCIHISDRFHLFFKLEPYFYNLYNYKVECNKEYVKKNEIAFKNPGG